MKAPYLPSFSDSWPSPQSGQRRGSTPSPRSGKMRAQKLVQAIEHLPGAEVLDVADRTGKVVPEVAQQRLPVDLAVRHLVELLLKIGGEIVADVFGEERFEEGRDDRPLSSGTSRSSRSVHNRDP